ncbi:MAG: AAA family ATPase, partial [Thermotogae bacterium]|nr:AAA family ATPase [Thermotogota bacterium]
MIIKRVRLKNFISHADTTIEFPLGVTVLIGPNGAGKTSVIDGIIFALFGIKVRGEKVTDVIRRGANSAEVEVVFEVDGREYTLRRERKSRTTEAILLKDGVPIARGQEVSAEIPRLLRMDKETIVNSIFVRQGEVASLVDAEPSQRKQLMGRLIGLDRLERAWGNMREVVSHFEDKVKEYDVVKKELELKQERKAEISREIEEIEKKLGEIRKELEVAEKELDEAEKEREIWRKKRDVYYDISEKLSGLRERKRSLERDVERLEKDLA